MKQETNLSSRLFFGQVAEEIAYPYPTMAEPERRRVQALLTALGGLRGSIDSTAIDRDALLPEPLVERVAAAGLFGSGLPTAVGGLGLSAMGHARVMSELGGADASLALSVYVHESLAARAISQFGGAELQARYGPRLAKGQLRAGFALAEVSGSDPTAMRTQLTREGDSYTLSGEKRWVTGADCAGLWVVFARTNAPEAGERPRLVALVVERGPQVTVGAPHDKLGLRGVQMCDVRFEAVPLTRAAFIGEPGGGYEIAMDVLSAARVALAGIWVGQCRAVVNESVKWVQERYSLGRSIGEFAIVKDKIARMMSDTFAVESMVHLTAGLADAGMDYRLESAMCRVAGSEALWRVVSDAMSLAGGAAYVRPHALERHLRDARGAFVIDGTNEILRTVIALRGLAPLAKRLKEVEQALREPVKGLGMLKQLARAKVSELWPRAQRSRCHPLLAPEQEQLEGALSAFQEACHRALTDHGAEVSEMQYTQLRVANIAIDLYAIIACLSRSTRAVQRRGEDGARRELDMTRMFTRAALSRVRGHLRKLAGNDDELRKVIAARAYDDNGYPVDVL